MKKEELITKVADGIQRGISLGMDPKYIAENLVDDCFNIAKEEMNNSSIESCISRIKQLAARNNIGNVEIELKF